ncbi:heptaprenyl diphosphate synthase component 1 [Lederbergia citrea]|uniref:Heptaprenyl diphosphate synthase component 1 n=1 Tax=Lederbergia citrea TaxID=2833581 RepID=A0A942UIR2_9BACI|nr:heptaprenyl diphosphate synthase component 1 [Lederbergia citrea]MBS4203123.1 heptaprenyl diphosphate synthase component 1 [Lederbergia citrea]MBS4222205.1 heptaprenyl diphosphate synthase component 1 [Lederbergia citrea]
MPVCDHEQQVDLIKKKLKKKSYHHYFSNHIGQPELDEDRILLLTCSLQMSNLPKEEREAYITASMFAQLALDTHDNVASPTVSKKQRQLAVLAGDYYSGMYYNLLAELHNIDLIKSLATAIKITNEQKILLYRYKGESIETFINSIKRVESALIEQFCMHFHNSAQYLSFAIEFLFFKKMVSELEQFKKGSSSIFISGLIQYYQPGTTDLNNLSDDEKEKIITECHRFIKESQKKMENMIRVLPDLPSILHVRIDDLASRYQKSCL